jgi:hypothetical protein
MLMEARLREAEEDAAQVTSETSGAIRVSGDGSLTSAYISSIANQTG